ncbi:hypothetical protein [Massiliimalia timonensis]|uniref:hypothetical protein n=1 Tax=Massiliimalia timonensis TaxID=1987501 RepID=UPI00189F3A24|nr:hypothetical protein [Massiliimalia timonensis]
MELYQEILLKVLERETVQVTFPGLRLNADEIIRQESYRALCNIKRILEDDSLEDPECFIKIEEIVRTLEEVGSNAGNRHDFG